MKIQKEPYHYRGKQYITQTTILEPNDTVYILYTDTGHIFTINLTKDHIDKKEPLFINPRGDKRNDQHIVYLYTDNLVKTVDPLESETLSSFQDCYCNCYHVLCNYDKVYEEPFNYTKNISYKLFTSKEIVLKYREYIQPK